jgi:cell division protein FtsB
VPGRSPRAQDLEKRKAEIKQLQQEVLQEAQGVKELEQGGQGRAGCWSRSRSLAAPGEAAARASPASKQPA